MMLCKPFFTVHEIAELLQVSEATVRGWIHSGELHAVKFGRDFRVANENLEAFLNAHATQPSSK